MTGSYSMESLDHVYKAHWRPGWGSIAKDEVLFVQSLIETHRPKKFLEIGMASGLSGGLIAQMLDWNGGEAFVSLDYDNTFFGDKTKPNGFLIDAIYQGAAVSVSKMPFKTSLDIPGLGDTFDMAFIDANHQHPWPTLDTLCLFPSLRGDKVVIHHDLILYKTQDVLFGVGPKYLYDQFPEAARIRASANKGNIYALVMTKVDRPALLDACMNSLYLPWTLRTPLSAAQIERFSALFSQEYGDELAATFNKCARRYNSVERLRTFV